MPCKLPHHLQFERRFSRALLTEHNRSAGIGRITVDFVPRWMKCCLKAGAFKHRVVLGVLFGKRITRNAVMLKEILDFHVAREPYLPVATMPSIIARKPSACFATVFPGP